MQFGNVYLPVQDLRKAPVKSGGLCSMVLFKWDDVAVWPRVNPLTGIVSNAIQLKAGGIFYMCQAVEKGRTFVEEEKDSTAGVYTDVTITATLAGNTSNNQLSVATMRYHRWGLILYDRDGNPKLVGDEDSGAKLLNRYSPEDLSGSRRRDLKWSWQPAHPLPLYQATAFPLSIGGITVVAGSLKLLQTFQVGTIGSPMAHGQTALQSLAFAGKKLLVLVDGVALPCDDGSGTIDWTAPQNAIRRHIRKTNASDTITFLGGVVSDEIIELYEIS